METPRHTFCCHVAMMEKSLIMWQESVEAGKKVCPETSILHIKGIAVEKMKGRMFHVLCLSVSLTVLESPLKSEAKSSSLLTIFTYRAC